jgi:hypothetical protein
MEAHIFAEGSNTTAGDPELPVKEYYEGLFGMVAGLHDELTEFADTHLHVLSEEYGVVEGHEHPSSIRKDQEIPIGVDEMVSTAKEELLRAAGTADVMVILLSTDLLRATVGQVWDGLVDEAKPASVWCLGAAQSALDELDFENLEAKSCSILTYQRVGVARIGTETREELLETVKQKADQ